MPTTTTATAATRLSGTPATAKAAKPHKPLPAPNSDFYYLYETLPAEELAIVKRVREFMETKVADYVLGWALCRANGSKLTAVLNQTDAWSVQLST